MKMLMKPMKCASPYAPDQEALFPIEHKVSMHATP